MKIISLPGFLVPKQNPFINLFEENSQNLKKTAGLLNELMKNGTVDVFDKIHNEIKDLEHIGDDITKKTYEQLNKSFITPFDRDDIHELTAHIDDVVDFIDGISRRMRLYKPKKISGVFRELSELIYEAAYEIDKAIHMLKNTSENKSEIMVACHSVKHIEHKADEIYYLGVAELFANEADTKELIKMSKILENLEKCINEEEKIANTIKTIIVKKV
jgi:uncharacterized protein